MNLLFFLPAGQNVSEAEKPDKPPRIPALRFCDRWDVGRRGLRWRRERTWGRCKHLSRGIDTFPNKKLWSKRLQTPGRGGTAPTHLQTTECEAQTPDRSVFSNCSHFAEIKGIDVSRILHLFSAEWEVLRCENMVTDKSHRVT